MNFPQMKSLEAAKKIATTDVMSCFLTMKRQTQCLVHEFHAFQQVREVTIQSEGTGVFVLVAA